MKQEEGQDFSVTADVNFAVVNVEHELPILGLNDCVNLGLIKRVSSICLNFKDKDDVLTGYKTAFEGLGQFPSTHHIQLKEGAIPQIRQSRRVPYSLQEKLKEKLDQLEETGVIRKVDKPTAWVNPLVIVEKPDKSLRICIDPMPLNKVVMREHFLMPHPDDILVTLSGYKYFTVLDLKDGFFQIVLDEESRELCTVSTPFGRYQFCRFPFGICSGPELCQKNNYKCFGNLKGVNIVHDDIIVGGTTSEEHDENLKRVLDTALKLGIKFNPNKMQFKKSEVKYLGHIVSAAGIQPDPDYVKAIVEMDPPTDKKGVMRLLGMLKYLSRFIPNLAKITAPLRYLTRKDVDFLWTVEHEDALKIIKTLISSEPVLVYFDSRRPLEIQTDASQDGLGCCLLQSGQPVAFMSRSMTDTEKRYSQIEKETLAIVFAVEKFHRFIYGYKVTVQTDHKPLVNIFQQDLHVVPGRLQKMRLRCLNYDLEVKYLPGSSQLIADTLSRAALKCTGMTVSSEFQVHSLTSSLPMTEEKKKLFQRYTEEDQETAIVKRNDTGMTVSSEFQVHSLTSSLPMTEEKKKLFQRYTEEDQETAIVKRYCKEVWPERKQDTPEIVRHYWNQRHMVSEEDGLLFLNHKLIVPRQLRQDMLQRIHIAHGGIEKCKARARQILYWPRMATDIESFVARCRICERFSRSNAKETLMPYPIPTRPWERIGCDIFSYGGNVYLVMMDAYSNWLELVKMPCKSATSVISACKDIFSRFGPPDIMVADNVPYNSAQMREFAREWNFEIVTRSPGYAQSKVQYDNKDLKMALLELRNMPVKHLGYSPAQLMFQRRCKTTIPVTEELLKPTLNDGVQDRLNTRQQLQKKYYDRSAKDLRVVRNNERVVFRNEGRWEQGKIVNQGPTPRSYWVEGDNGATLRRNRRHLKPSLTQQNNSQSVPRQDEPVQLRPRREIKLPSRFQNTI
ncbi:uncharacterized protein K02A2.6-like [Macrosteles quadrilineatus]|uniref:uncharacterized protein K02A2.6-like n=1 Tax=Macrosteles quadrilineatus TaxID=74068 RepID=UPI0023E16C27|nr:uncharacterized protein K02A2.6-like [Macrosteles quadrilineatus]